MNPLELLEWALRELARLFAQDGPIGNIIACTLCTIEATVEIVDLEPSVGDSTTPLAGTDQSQGQPIVLLARTPYTERVAYRIIRVRFHPASCFAGTTVTWELLEGSPFRGNMPTADQAPHPDRFEAVPRFAFVTQGEVTPNAPGTTPHPVGPTAVHTRLTAAGDFAETKVRVNLPSVGGNKAAVTVRSDKCPDVFFVFELDVPVVVVLDPGHGGGGDSEYPVSGANNAESWPYRVNSTTLWEDAWERELTLDLAFRIRDALVAEAEARGIPIVVELTRETPDVNPSLSVRANVGRDNGADLFLSIHFNAVGGDNLAYRPVAQYDSVSNVNTDADIAFAANVSTATHETLEPYYSMSTTRDPRGTEPQERGALRDEYLGNGSPTSILNPNPIRACLLEVEFIDNQYFSRLWNFGELDPQEWIEAASLEDEDLPEINQDNIDLVRNATAGAIATAIIDTMYSE